MRLRLHGFATRGTTFGWRFRARDNRVIVLRRHPGRAVRSTAGNVQSEPGGCSPGLQLPILTTGTVVHLATAVLVRALSTALVANVAATLQPAHRAAWGIVTHPVARVARRKQETLRARVGCDWTHDAGNTSMEENIEYIPVYTCRRGFRQGAPHDVYVCLRYYCPSYGVRYFHLMYGAACEWPVQLADLATVSVSLARVVPAPAARRTFAFRVLVALSPYAAASPAAVV